MEKDWTQLRVATGSSPGVAAVATRQASTPPVFLLLFAPTPHIQNLFSVQQPDCLFQKGHIKTSSGPPISIIVTQKAQKELPPTTYLASLFFPALPLWSFQSRHSPTWLSESSLVFKCFLRTGPLCGTLFSQIIHTANYLTLESLLRCHPRNEVYLSLSHLKFSTCFSSIYLYSISSPTVSKLFVTFIIYYLSLPCLKESCRRPGIFLSFVHWSTPCA